MLPAATNSVTLNPADLSAYDPYPMHRGSRERYLCPFCGADYPRDNAHRCLSLDAIEGLFICFRCGMKGKLGSTGNVASRISAQEMAERAQVEREHDWQSIQQANAMWRTCRSAKGTHGSAYLVCHRGISGVWISQCQIRYAKDWFGAPALVFPGRDENGYLNTAQGRYLGKSRDGLRMRTAGKAMRGMFSTFSLKNSLYPARIAIAEAPLDALSYAELFGTPAIASMGCWQQKWLLPLARQRGCQEVVISTDNDKAGEEAALRWERLAMEQGLKSIRHRPELKDFNDVIRHKKGLL